MLSATDLQIIQRFHVRLGRATDALFVGEYRSAFLGQGMEFADVRRYVPGDDVRRIDWNVTARTGIPHVKEFKEEREMTVMLVVDVSASMRFRTKRRLCAQIAGALAFAGMRNGDRVGLLLLGEHVRSVLPPSKKNGQAWNILRSIIKDPFQDRKIAFAKGVERLQRLMPKRSVVCVISDFLDKDWEAIFPLSGRHKVHCFGLRDELEQSWPFQAMVEIQDSETGERRLVDGRQMEQDWWPEQSRQMTAMGIPNSLVSSTENPIVLLLKHFRRVQT